MTRAFSASAHKAFSPAYRVEAPRASDAIGLALRCAFDGDTGLPEDMTAMLRRLNQPDPQRRH